MTAETALYLRVDGRVVRVEGRSAVIGRSKSCEVKIEANGVSRRHCEVFVRDDGAYVRDLGSSHSTFVGDVRVQGEERVAAGAKIYLGPRGPNVEVVDAVIQGRPVLGSAKTRPRTVTDLHPHAADHSHTAEFARPAAAAAGIGGDRAPAPSGSRFWQGLCLGLLVGAAVGVGVVACVRIPW
jgi:pSer/pThr/pTyr-binding forkhead associated (FHA) protein